MESASTGFRLKVAAGLAVMVVFAANVMNRAGYATAAQTAAGTVAAPATAVAAPGILRVEGAVPVPLSLTADDLAKMPRATAPLTADGVTSTYEGVLLYDILVKAGWQFGHGMTGKPMASYLIATGKDGYQVVFALAEIDPQFSGAKVIVADKADGGPLPAKLQPFRLVAPQDKMHARSIYSVVKLEVVRLRP